MAYDLHVHALLYSKAILPIQLEMRMEDTSCDEGEEDVYWQKMNDFRDGIYKKAKVNIDKAQFKQKQYYDNKRGRREVCIL